MALKIRLQMTGKRNARSFRIVAVDESQKRDGRVVEILGHVNTQVKPHKVEVKKDRLDYWQGKGAQMTDGTKKVFAP